VGNEDSLVIRLTLGRTAFLLTGDTGATTERALLGSGADLRSDVLKAGHHGSAASTSPEFLAAVRPRFVLISVGEGNTYGFPGRDLLARCRKAGARVLRTDVDGAVEVRTDGRRVCVRTSV
jgi:competence protein ComEC